MKSLFEMNFKIHMVFKYLIPLNKLLNNFRLTNSISTWGKKLIIPLYNIVPMSSNVLASFAEANRLALI